jgi:hypothetical protein
MVKFNTYFLIIKIKIMAYYIATVKVQDENERGRITNTNEVYCVEAETVTEAEAKVVKEFEGYQLDYHVKSVKESKIIKILE